MKITRIRIPAEFRVDDTRTRTAVADFQLGVGPCGKEVEELTFNILSKFPGVEVIQQHSDGTRKNFLYPYAQVTGRIEVEHGE